MCLSPISIYNPTSRISISGGQPLKLDVPCCKCAECKKAKRLEWHFRTYYECLHCVNNGGFIYFDTLTYSSLYLPKLSRFIDIRKRDEKGNIIYKDKEKKKPATIVDDFSCFNSRDLQLFLKNMRRQLEYHYTGVRFSYFLTSEYGLDDRFTHRPHYHILFFVYGDMDPYDFSELVSKCWDFGRTDGLPYQERSYVANHIYGIDLGVNKEFNNYTKVTNYVAKYISKDSSFQETLDSRKAILAKYYNDDILNPIYRKIDMFHRQSQGFGLSYITTLDEEECNFIKENNACRIKDSDKVVLVIPLPQYYNRKLFYKMLKDNDGKYFWQPTYDGALHLERTAINSIRKFTNRLKSQISNYDDTTLAYIKSILDGRTLEDYSVYMLFYRNRSRDLCTDFIQKLSFKYDTLTDNELNLFDWIQNTIVSKYVRTHSDDLYFYRDRDNNTLAIPNCYDLFSASQSISYKSIIKNLTFNENSCRAFRYFDRLTAYLRLLERPNNYQKQSTFDFIENLTKKFKVLYE